MQELSEKEQIELLKNRNAELALALQEINLVMLDGIKYEPIERQSQIATINATLRSVMKPNGGF